MFTKKQSQNKYLNETYSQRSEGGWKALSLLLAL